MGNQKALRIGFGSLLHIMRGSEDVDVRPTIADIVHSRGILLVGSVIDADVVVCENPGNPPGIIKWALVLTVGVGIICTHRALAGLDGGAYITYKAAISCKEKRFIMITPSCQREHPDYCSILRQAIANHVAIGLKLMKIHGVRRLFLMRHYR